MTSKAERLRRKKTVIVTKGGRPRRWNVGRHPGGQIVRADKESGDELPEAVMAVARAQPHRRAIAELIFAKNPLKLGVNPETLAGSAIGRLYLSRTIQEHQFIAGSRYAEALARDRAIIGLPAPTTQAIEYGRVVGGGKMEIAASEALKAGERLLQLRRVLAEVEWPGDSVRPAIVVRQVALEDRDENTLGETEIGALRVALNALARHYSVDMSEISTVAA